MRATKRFSARATKRFSAMPSLMASAPDMEQALKAIRKDVIAEHGRVMPSTILQMQAALNKAKGETT